MSVECMVTAPVAHPSPRSSSPGRPPSQTMLFNSFQFALFFPLVTLLYFALPHARRGTMLLLASCLFYMAFVPAYIVILFVTILIDYVAGIRIEAATGERRRAWLVLSIVSTCAVLFVFK